MLITIPSNCTSLKFKPRINKCLSTSSPSDTEQAMVEEKWRSKIKPSSRKCSCNRAAPRRAIIS